MMSSMRKTGAGVLACLGAVLLIVGANGGGGDKNARCVDNAHHVLTGLQTYVQDWDETFPPMTDAAQFQAIVGPWTSSPHRFVCPATGQLYSPNTALSETSLAAVSDPGVTFAFKDAVAHADGKFTVAFLDNHVERGGVDQENPNTACVENARQLTQSILAYSQDYDEMLPNFQTVPQFYQEINPYVHAIRRDTCPATHLLYTPNFAWSGVGLISIAHLDTTFSVEDAAPHKDHKSTVAFLDGHVERGGVDQTPPDVGCLDRVKKLTLGILEYAQDHDDVLPPMQDPTTFKTAVYPYVRSDSAFICPSTGQVYLPNPALSGKPLRSFPVPSEIEVVMDPVPHKDGVVTIGYLDGYVLQNGHTMIPRVVETRNRIKQLGLAMLMYSQDYDEVLPVMRNYRQYESSLLPYTRTDRVFINPFTGGNFLVNYSLSGVSLASILNPATTEAVRAPRALPDGRPIIGYVDGHVSH